MARRWISIVFAIVIALVLIFAVGFYYAVRIVPFQPTVLEAQHQPTIVYARDGSKLMSLGAQGTDLTYSQIPKDLQNAIVATEDHTFWNNSGIDLKSILRSVFVDISSGSLSQGASTIPEQLAKMAFLTDQKTFVRKFKQILLGVQITRHFTKQEILAMYLNRVPMSESSTGVDQGALRYFGIDLKKHPSKLTLSDAALLAGLPQAPSAYDPLQHPKAALQRRNQVLQNMAHWGYISQAAATQAEQKPIGASFHQMPGDGWDTKPLLTNFLLDYLKRHHIPSREVNQGGLKIYTTIDPSVQSAVRQVFWDKKYDSDFPGPKTGTVVQGAALFVDPSTGGILGAAGSRQQGYTPLGLDRVYAQASPGSSIKPVMDYAPALATGNWDYTSVLNNTPHNFGGGYTPQNWNVNGPSKVTLQYGLEWSQNVASVWLLQQIGIKTGADFAKKDGIPLTSQDYQHLGIAIGGMQNGVSTMQMAAAYTPFDNHGVRSQPFLVKRIVNGNGAVIFSESPKQTFIITSDVASKMTRLMQDVVAYGTGQAAQLGQWGVAGKTGTVQYDTGLTGSHPNWVRDGWFDGYTPNLVGSIHIAYDQSSAAHHMTMSPQDPSGNAAKIFHDIIALALKNQKAQQFSVGPYPAATGTATAANNLPSTQPGNNANNPQVGISNLQATYKPSSNEVTLTWSGHFPTSVTYVVTRATLGQGTNGQEQPIGQTANTTTVDSNANPFEAYQYTVQATDPNSGQPVGSPATVLVQTVASGSGQTFSGQGNTTGTNNTANGTGNGAGNGTGNVTIGNGTGNNSTNVTIGNATASNGTSGSNVSSPTQPPVGSGPAKGPGQTAPAANHGPSTNSTPPKGPGH